MKAKTPEEIPNLILEALNSGDSNAVSLLYEEGGVVAADVTEPVRGRPAVRVQIEGFLATGPRFTLVDTEVLQSGNIALIRSQWTIAMIDAEGKISESGVCPTLVVRQQPEGNWLVLIDRPVMT